MSRFHPAASLVDWRRFHSHAAPSCCDNLKRVVAQVHHDSSGDFYSLGGDTVLHVLQHDGLTVDEETVRTESNQAKLVLQILGTPLLTVVRDEIKIIGKVIGDTSVARLEMKDARRKM